MTKKEIKSAINKSVYQFAESLGYTVSDDNDGSYVTFMKPNANTADDSIDYSRSFHECCVLSWSSEECKADAELIDEYAKQQQSKYNQ